MPQASLDAGEVRVLACATTEPVAKPATRDTTLDRHGLAARRIAIEAIDPTVPDGPFAVKRLVGDTVTVTADIFADGHDILSAELLWNTADEAGWHRVPMTLVENDRWEASFAPSGSVATASPSRPGGTPGPRSVTTVHAKHAAGQAVTLEIEEGPPC